MRERERFNLLIRAWKCTHCTLPSENVMRQRVARERKKGDKRLNSAIHHPLKWKAIELLFVLWEMSSLVNHKWPFSEIQKKNLVPEGHGREDWNLLMLHSPCLERDLTNNCERHGQTTMFQSLSSPVEKPKMSRERETCYGEKRLIVWFIVREETTWNNRNTFLWSAENCE